LIVFLEKTDFRIRTMKQVVLNVKTRDALGSAAVKRLRREGQIPAVLYGESGVHHVQVGAEAFFAAWRKMAGRATLLELHMDGAEESTFTILKDYQRNARTDRFEHLDLLEVVRGKDMEADIPVVTKGTAFGVKNQQGVLEINAHELNVRCRPRDLPEEILIDVTTLKVGDSLHVEDLPPIEGVTFNDPSDLVVVSCVGASGGKSGDEEEEESVEERSGAAETEESREKAETTA
jgi:large subunit ribosomal protein L25